MIGLIGRKVGMTRVFTEDGSSIPVSVVKVIKNRISQIKTTENDGYLAIQLTAGEKKSSRVNKPLAGHFSVAQVEAGDMLSEFRVDSIENFTSGQLLGVEDLFSSVNFVDVTGYTKGKGYAGTVKRHNFRTQDASHGNSVSHRSPGSIGQNQTPGKVFKGKKMAGRLGNTRCTTQNLELIRVDAERDLLLIKGSIPGHPGSRIMVKPAIKKSAGDRQ